MNQTASPSFHATILAAMQLDGITAGELALETDITPDQISRILSGERRVPIEVMHSLYELGSEASKAAILRAITGRELGSITIPYPLEDATGTGVDQARATAAAASLATQLTHLLLADPTDPRVTDTIEQNMWALTKLHAEVSVARSKAKDATRQAGRAPDQQISRSPDHKPTRQAG